MLLFLLNLAAQSGITGTGSVSDGTEAVASSSTVAVAATGAAADGSETAASSGAQPISGTGTVGDGGEAVSGSDAGLVSGSGSVSDGSETTSSSGMIADGASGAPSDGPETAAGTIDLPGEIVEPITLDAAKRQLRNEDSTDDDAFISDLITAARQHVEKYCGISLVSTTEEMTFCSFDDLAQLTLAPIQSITDVRYLDTSGAEQVLDSSTYEFGNVRADILRPRIRLAFGKSWPAIRPAIDDAVRVNATIGYTDVPRPIIQAMLMLISQWYDLRLPVAVDMRGVPAEVPNAVTALLANYRR